MKKQVDELWAWLVGFLPTMRRSARRDMDKLASYYNHRISSIYQEHHQKLEEQSKVVGEITKRCSQIEFLLADGYYMLQVRVDPRLIGKAYCTRDELTLLSYYVALEVQTKIVSDPERRTQRMTGMSVEDFIEQHQGTIWDSQITAEIIERLIREAWDASEALALLGWQNNPRRPQLPSTLVAHGHPFLGDPP